MNWTLLLHSLGVGVLTTGLAAVLGLLAAAFVYGLTPAWRMLAYGLAVVAFALPPFLVTNTWLSLLGQTGSWRAWLPVNLYSMGGTVWILALMLWPLTLFALLGAWQRLEPSQVEGESALAGWALIRWLLLPAGAPAMAQAAVLTFVLGLNQFTVPSILQVKVLPVEVWLEACTKLDSMAAFEAAWPLVVAPLVMLVWLSRQEIAWPRFDGAVSAAVFRRRLGRGWFAAGAVAMVALAGFAVALPLALLLGTPRTWIELVPAAAAGHRAAAVSVLSAAAGATLVVGFGIVTARWRAGVLAWPLLLMPGVLVGIVLIFLLNRPPWLAVYRSLAMIAIASAVRFSVLGWVGARLARQAVDPDLVDAGRLEGASGWALFRRVLWPQMAPALAAAWFVIYLLGLWEVETLSLIVPPGGETLALRIFSLLHYGHNTQVNALCLLLLLAAVLPLLLWPLGRAGRALLSLGRRPAAGRLAVVGLVGLAGCSDGSPADGRLISRFFNRVEVLGTRGTGPGQFNKPRSLALDRDDNLFVVDMTGRVQKFDRDGHFLVAWQMPETDLGRPKGMGLDAAGHVVVIEPHYSRVNHFDSNGRLTQQWGVHGTNEGQLAFPRSVAVNSKGEFWISEYGVVERVQRFTPDGGRRLAGFGRFGDRPGEFNRPEGLGIDAQDRLYVADSCNHRIQVFEADGRWLRSYGRAGSGLGELSYPYDVRIDAEGNQWVCEFGNSRLQVFDPTGRPIEVIGGPGAAPGQFSNPWSLAFDSQGNLYVADAGNHRVQKLVRRDPPRSAGQARAGSPGGEALASLGHAGIPLTRP